MNQSTSCIVYPEVWLKGAIFQPVFQDGTRNLSQAFLASAWDQFKGGMSIMSFEISWCMEKVTQQAQPPSYVAQMKVKSKMFNTCQVCMISFQKSL